MYLSLFRLSPPGLQKLVFFPQKGSSPRSRKFCLSICVSLITFWDWESRAESTRVKLMIHEYWMIFSDTEPGVCKWTNCNRSGWRVDRAAGHHMVCVAAKVGKSSTFWQGRNKTDFRGADFKKNFVQSFYIDKTWFWLWIEMASTATPNVLVLVTFIYSANVWHQVLSNWRQRLLQASRQNIYKIGPYHKSGMSGSQVAGLSSHSMIWTFLVHNLFGPLQLEKDFASYLNIASLI